MGFKKTSIKVLKGQRTASGHGRDGIAVQDGRGNSIAVFRGEKHERDKVVVFSHGTKHVEYVPREEGNRILGSAGQYAMSAISRTAFTKSLGAKTPNLLGRSSSTSGTSDRQVCVDCGQPSGGKPRCKSCWLRTQEGRRKEVPSSTLTKSPRAETPKSPSESSSTSGTVNRKVCVSCGQPSGGKFVCKSCWQKTPVSIGREVPRDEPVALGRVVISCATCGTGLRLPAGKTGMVRCPKCSALFHTSTR